jgi:hypothetical protein
MLTVTSNGYENVSGNCRVKSSTAKHLMHCFDPRGLLSVQFAVGEALEIGRLDYAALRIDLRGNEANPPLVIASMHAASGEISWLRDSLSQQYVCARIPMGVTAFQRNRTCAEVRQCMASFYQVRLRGNAFSGHCDYFGDIRCQQRRERKRRNQNLQAVLGEKGRAAGGNKHRITNDVVPCVLSNGIDYNPGSGPIVEHPQFDA